MAKKNNVYVIGHKSPDTDSICSAISYAYLKNQLDKSHDYIPKRAGDLNPETAYVLEQAKVQAPEYLGDVRTQVGDIEFAKGTVVDSSTSVKRAWETLREKKDTTLAVLNSERQVVGLVTVGDIAKSMMELHTNTVLADSKTSYENLVDTLDAEVLTGDIKGKTATGRVIIAAANPDQLEDLISPGDIVVLSNRYEAQLCAIEMKAAVLVICVNGEINQNILQMCEKKGIVVMRTKYDSFVTARLINQSIPISYFMIRDNILGFQEDSYVDDVSMTMADVRKRQFPVMDEKGRFVGMLKRQALLEMEKKKLILVDHNEVEQAVDGIEEAEILEIIDHHKLGNVETFNPVMFRCQPVGCTSTILYMMYQENGVRIPKQIAFLMCSAILSDTLMFRSPTCTPADEKAGRDLADIAGIDITQHAKAMFSAASNFDNMTDHDILYGDFKRFTTGKHHYGVGQVSSMDGDTLDALKGRLAEYMESELAGSDLDMIFLMLTDILAESTQFLCIGGDAARLVAEAAGQQVKDGNSVYLEGVVSRKKQVVPLLSQALS